MNTTIKLCPSEITLKLTELNFQLWNMEIDVNEYNRKVAELQSQVDKEKANKTIGD